jgi:hypothetical protein
VDYSNCRPASKLSSSAVAPRANQRRALLSHIFGVVDAQVYFPHRRNGRLQVNDDHWGSPRLDKRLAMEGLTAARANL